jgi:hypothetical protein
VVLKDFALTILSTNRVADSEALPFRQYTPWEPSAGAGTSWTTAYNIIDENPNSPVIKAYVRNFASGWANEQLLSAPDGSPLGDLYLQWDPFKRRFLLCAIDLKASPTVPITSVYFGYSLDEAGTAWEIRATPFVPLVDNANPINSYGWDYPSIGVDSTGRIAIGAVKIGGDNKFWVAMSSDTWNTYSSRNFSTFSMVSASPPPNTIMSAFSRVVGTSDRFHVFVPTLSAEPSNPSYLPVAVSRTESIDCISWSPPSTLFTFEAEALNLSLYRVTAPPSIPVYFSPKLDARGAPSGHWAVVFQAGVLADTNTTPVDPLAQTAFNNVVLCTSGGCGYVNLTRPPPPVAAPYAYNDQFLPTTAITIRPNGQADYWVSYLTNVTVGTVQSLTDRTLNTWPPAPQQESDPTTNGILAMETIYFPAGSSLAYERVASGIDPRAWRKLIPSLSRCTVDCYAAGDYGGMAANPFSAATMPFVARLESTGTNSLKQVFVQDPPAKPSERMAPPNYVPVPSGLTRKTIGKAGQVGGNPRLRRGPLAIRPANAP